MKTFIILQTLLFCILASLSSASYLCKAPISTSYGSVTECTWESKGQPNCCDVKNYFEGTSDGVKFGAKIDSPSTSTSGDKLDSGGCCNDKDKYEDDKKDKYDDDKKDKYDDDKKDKYDDDKKDKYDDDKDRSDEKDKDCDDKKDKVSSDDRTDRVAKVSVRTASTSTSVSGDQWRIDLYDLKGGKDYSEAKFTVSNIPGGIDTVVCKAAKGYLIYRFNQPVMGQSDIPISCIQGKDISHLDFCQIAPAPVCELNCQGAPQKECGQHVRSACVFQNEAQCDQPGVICEGSTASPYTGVCQYEYSINSSSTVCRPAQIGADGSTCDRDDYCTGSSLDCPPDEFLTQGTQCRIQGGLCDVADVCSGASPVCEDVKKFNGEVCRTIGGPCDVEEYCDGVNDACPDDRFRSSSTICRAKAGPCDIDDYCSGSDVTCHDSFLPNTTLCRPADGPCDVDDFCSGSSATCEDGKQPTGYRFDFLIDHFKTSQTVSVEAMAPPTQSAGGFASTLTAIGGERDLYVAKTSGFFGERLRVRINPNGEEFFRGTADEATGMVIVTWDGYDGLPGPNEVNYTGLGGVDLSDYGELEIEVTFSDLGGPVQFTLWDAEDPTGNTYATQTALIPGSIESGQNQQVVLNFSTFVATGAPIENILDSVGAIQMTIDQTADDQRGWDYRFVFIKSVGYC